MRRPREYREVYCTICKAITSHSVIRSLGFQVDFVQCEDCAYRKIIDLRAVKP